MSVSVEYPTKSEITRNLINSDRFMELAQAFLDSNMSALACEDYTDGIKKLYTDIGNEMYAERLRAAEWVIAERAALNNDEHERGFVA